MSETVDASSATQLPVAKLDNPELKEPEGLRMDFIIDNTRLILHTLASTDKSRFSSQEHREDIVAFQKSARAVSKECYDLAVREEPLDEEVSVKVTEFLTKIEQTSEFQKIRQQTEVYLVSIKAEWERNYPKTAQAVQEMTGVDLNKQVTVYVTHPSLKNGQYRGNNTIVWGHTPEWDNYATVYLWHEILHSYFDYTDLSHSLIQLVADNELRTRLNPGETYPPFVGHEDLFPLMDTVLPHWRTYLAETPTESRRDILGFEEKLRAMPEFQETSQEKSPATPIIE